MPETITPKRKRQDALRSVSQMTQPAGMGRVTWEQVHKVLMAIADCYPNAYPSQMRLAARTGIPERSLQRYIAVAKKAGLLAVKANAGAPPRRSHGACTNRYLLLVQPATSASSELLTQPATLAYQENTYSVGVSTTGTSSLKTSSSETRPSDRPAAGQDLRGGQIPSAPRPTVVQMSDWMHDRDTERQLDPPERSSLQPTKWVRPADVDVDGIVRGVDTGRRQKRAPQRDPAPEPEWKRLADYFAVCWEQMQRSTGRHKDTRGLENYRMVKRYWQVHFKNRSELEVRKMMEEFVIAVAKRDITVKDGQSAWMCFTGAWGRQRHAVIEGRYATYRTKG